MSENDKEARLELLILCLTASLGRLPTEDEAIEFITGTKETREKIWNEGELRRGA